MKLWKSLLATLLVLAAILTFVACDSGSKKKSRDDDDEDESEESSNVSGNVSGEVSGEASGAESSEDEISKETSKEDEDTLDGTVWEGEIDYAEMVKSLLMENEEVYELLEDFDSELSLTVYMEFDEDTVELGYRKLSKFEDDYQDYIDEMIKYIYDNSDVEEDYDEFYENARVNFPESATDGMENESADYTYEDGVLEIDGDEVEIKNNKIDIGGVVLKKK